MKKDEWNLEGQMSIFDFPEALPQEEPKVSIDDIAEADILQGSGFDGDKKRIYEYFLEEKDDRKRADFLKGEYGVGGRIGEHKGIKYMQDHSANGIDIKPYEPIGKTIALHLEWLMVARIIERLIVEHRYKVKE